MNVARATGYALAASAAPAHMVRYGEGPRVFAALHGWSGSGRSFDPLVPFMPDDVSLYSVEQPGFGATRRPERWTIPDLVAPVVAAAGQLPAGPMTLVGNCAGAIVALHAALALGPRVERVVMIDPFAYAPWYFSLFDWPAVGGLFYALAFANPLGRVLTNVGLSRHRNPSTDLVEGFRSVRHFDNWRYIRVLVRSARFGVTPFAGYRGEVHILHGERTFAAIRRSIDMWRRVFPGLTVHEIPATGHIPVHENPEAVARLVFADGPAR